MKYDRLTQYIEIFQPGYSAGTWFFDKEHSGTVDDPIQMPFVMFDQNMMKFMDEFYESGIAVKNYKEIMETAGIEDEQFDFVNLHILNEEVVCAILTYIIRADRFCEGYLKSKIEQGTVTRLLIRLKDIDEYNPYPNFHVDFVKGQRIAEVQTVMLKDMGFPYDLESKDTEYKSLDSKMVARLEDEFMYLIEELLPRNLQDLFYIVGLEPCQAYWKIYEGAVRRLQIPRCENHNNKDYGKFIGYVEDGIKDLYRKGYTFTEIYESTCATKGMISEIDAERFNQEINTSEIDRILFRQSDCRYTCGVIIDHVIYDYAVERDGKTVLLIKVPIVGEPMSLERKRESYADYAGIGMIPVLVIDSYELQFNDSLGKEITMALRDPSYVSVHNERESMELDDFDEEILDGCYIPREDYEPVHIGRVKRIKLVSNCLCYGPAPMPEDEAEQHLTICSDGRVFFSSYIVGNREDFKYEKARMERHDITDTKANYILATIGSFFEEKYIENFATDCGNWDIEIINEQDRKFHFGGSLCTDLVYRQEALSLLLREFIEMPELLGFDGDIRNEIHVDEGEYIFVEVSFESSEKTYCYICDDKLIQEYDEVLVPVGQDNIEKVAIVESVEVHTEDDAPYPVEKCKHVIKRLV